MQRVGVFVCWCGSNIAGTVDVQAVSEALKNEPGVVFSTNYQYMCSQAGQDMIKDAVKEHNLTGIVVCSCSPRMHEATFRKTVKAASGGDLGYAVGCAEKQMSGKPHSFAFDKPTHGQLGLTAKLEVQCGGICSDSTANVLDHQLIGKVIANPLRGGANRAVGI